MALINCPKCGTYNTCDSTECLKCGNTDFPFTKDNIGKRPEYEMFSDDEYVPNREEQHNDDNWLTEYKKMHPWDWWIKLDKILG